MQAEDVVEFGCLIDKAVPRLTRVPPPVQLEGVVPDVVQRPLIKVDQFPHMGDLLRPVQEPLESADQAPASHVGSIQPPQHVHHASTACVPVCSEEHPHN